MATKKKLVVVGNGMAGARFVEEVLALGGQEQYDITVFGEEPYGNYNRILLSGVLAGTHDEKDIFINPLSWYEKNGITLHAGVRVIGIDRKSKTAYGAGGLLVPYDKLVVATGSSPFIPPMDGLHSDDGSLRNGIFPFRTLDDCNEMVEYSEDARRATVIGGGLLGLEAARGLMNRGVDVDVVHLTPYIMDQQLDASSGDMLKDLLEDMGVRFHLEKLTTTVHGNGKVTGVGFRDGDSLDCEMLVISAGIRPNIDLARMSGLNIRRGILVNDDLSCRNDRDIYAIGECAEHRGRTYGLVAPLWDQARTLAERLTSEESNATYTGSKVSTKLKVMGVELAVAGDKDPVGDDDEVVSYVEPNRGVYKKLIVRQGKVAGAILLGDGAAAPRLLQAFDRGEALPQNRAELLFPLSGEAESLDISDMPDDAQVCNCNGVSKGNIVAAVGAGCRSMKAVCDATRAGTGCGSCIPQVQAILELAADGLVAEDPSEHYYVPAIPMTKPELVAAIKAHGLRSVSAVLSEFAGGKEDAPSKMGLASLLKTIWADEYEDERDARFINDRVHANIQRDGTFSVVPRIFGGVTSPDELRRLADVAEKYEAKMVKVTGGQRIDLLGIPKTHLPDVWRELKMPSGHAYTKAFRTCKTCVGTEFCRYGVGDSVKLGIEIEKRFQGVESPHKMKLAASGCPRNCAESTTKDLGVVAIEGGKWEIYIGGAAGSQVRKGDVLCVVDSHDDVLKFMGRFMQYYRENAKYLERTYGFVERVGIDHIKSVLLDDSEGICDRLDADIQAAVDDYKDPWQEAEIPVHPNQFVSVAG
ncbi:MAG: NAD(P)/FAD-dependent oxidoreductase [Chloroflexi bacterium]|nr:NAD(P)/FAD-dependent oxidoreductase [Chloroflexota bacterium]